MKISNVVIIIGITAAALVAAHTLTKRSNCMPSTISISTVEDVVALCSCTVPEIQARVARAKKEIEEVVNTIIALPNESRTFENTIYPLDRLSASPAGCALQAAVLLEYVSPEEAIRNAAHQAAIEMEEYSIERVQSNRALYKAVKAYAQKAAQEHLTEEQRYVLDDMIQSWERHGLSLPDEQLHKVQEVKKQLAALSVEFERNIAADNSTVEVTPDQLVGYFEEAFYKTLKKNEQGNYLVTLDYPTYEKVMELCTVPSTRQKVYQAFVNRAYATNESILREIIKTRAELAHLLGYPSYAALDLADQMVENPANAHRFLDQVTTKARLKADQEFSLLTQHLPESVELTAQGKLQPYDVAFVKYLYKKHKLNVDEARIAEYFPLEHTLAQLFEVYKAFFGLEFIEVKHGNKLWHEEVKLLEAYDSSTGRKIGYLLLDIHPRPNKYSHAAQVDIVPSTYDEQGHPNGALAMVITNFSRPTDTTPALLRRNEVNTFFHEFGHAIHTLLGRTRMASKAGAHVKRDFVELPSQMLEEWLADPSILKMVSCHYKTGEPLSDEVIDKIIALKQFSTGSWIMQQLVYANLALAYFESATVDPYVCFQEIHNKLLQHIAFDAKNHFYTSFGHLTNYGAKYYGYLWSQVYALDVFETIKKEGLLNPTIGARYINAILSKGGTVDPNVLLKNFLGRAPSESAFMKSMGL
jgi:thimet oligopeptidase